MLTRYTFALSSATFLASACGNGQPGAPCPAPDGLFQCHRGTVEEHVSFGDACIVVTVDDGQPCRTGVGLCEAGHCTMPADAPAACGTGAMPPGGVCGFASDCHGPNLCADYTCPNPWLDGCVAIPKPDGTMCDNGLACLHGSCCLPVAPAACSVGTTGNSCRAIEDCTVGECGTDGVCRFVRSPAGATCFTSAGDAGKCVQNTGDYVPRCLPLSGG